MTIKRPQSEGDPLAASSGAGSTRREAMRAIAGATLLPLLGCGGSGTAAVAADADTARDATGDTPPPNDASAMDAAETETNAVAPDTTPADAVDVAADAPPDTQWARGGTASMTARDQYPDPFAAGLGACALVVPMTAGPCTTESPPVREDVSEGWTGLPMRLVLKVVNQECAPVAGASVRIWHTNIEGSYSGQTPSNRFCLLNQDHAASNFFRGEGTTNAEGVVAFDSCYPGWYPGRAIHIHFQVTRGDVTYRVSQLFFPEAVTNDIFANHPEYVAYGMPDTTLATDGIASRISASALAELTCDVARMPDGAMLASKTIAVA